MLAYARSAFTDIGAGIKMRHVWLALAQEDIDDQHRRTTLGPIWMLANYLIYMIAFMLIFNGHAVIPNFVAYIAVGMLVFSFLQEVMTRSVLLFRADKALIAGTTLPITVYVLRLATQIIVRTGYATLGCLAILLLSGTPITTTWLWSIPGVIEVLLLMAPVTVLFAMGGAYFPDLQFIIANAVRVSLFLTPIFWVSGPGAREALSHYNPMTYFIEVVRVPVVTGEVPGHAMIVCMVFILMAWAAAIYLLGKCRREIMFLV